MHSKLYHEFYVINKWHMASSTLNPHKRLSSLLLALAAALTALAGGPLLHVEENTIDFGMIREADGPATRTFTLRNDGDSPLIIISAKTQCGCTTPTIPKEPLRPGQSATLSVTYDPAGRPGEFEKTIRLRTNQKGKRQTLKIKGTVLPKSKADK